jgi:hypothetical protein
MMSQEPADSSGVIAMGWEREVEVGWKATRKRHRRWRFVLPLLTAFVASILAILVMAGFWLRQLGAALVASVVQGIAMTAALISLMLTIALMMIALVILETPPLLLPFHPIARFVWTAGSMILRGELSP